MIACPLTSTLFPYTTLFRSLPDERVLVADQYGAHLGIGEPLARLLRRVRRVEGDRIGNHRVAREARHGKIPRATSAAATSRTAATSAAFRSWIFFSAASSQTRSNASFSS